MRLLIMGAPGAGKGTQAALIKEAYGIAHISTGDMFRKAIALQTAMGLEAKKYMDQGFLVPDSITIKIVKERLEESDCSNGFLLDGFPRTVAQAVVLNDMLNEIGAKLDSVLNIVVQDEYLIDRLTGRRTCSKCGLAYHITSNKPEVCDVCDVCAAPLTQRLDDTYETIKNRLDVYYQKTEPVLRFYQEQGLVNDVQGVGNIDEIFRRIKKVLGEFDDHNKK